MYKKVIEELERNRQRRIDGDLIAIPWRSLPRLNKVLPGVQQGKYYLVAARPKGAKTQFTDFLFQFEPFDWWYENRDNTNIDIKIDYFSLEMSSSLKWISAISYKLFKSHGIIISPQNLRSVFEKYVLDKQIIQHIKAPEFQHWLKLFEEKVTFNDSIRNPTGIFKQVAANKEANGKWSYKNIDWHNDNGEIEVKKVKDKYTPNNPDLYHIVITDHIGLLSTEKGGSLYQSIQKFSSEYCIKLRDMYNVSPVNVQQISATAATATYTSSGKLIVDDLIPSDTDLSDNRHTSMDVNVMLTLFWPYKYKIKEYEGWDLTKIGNNHRQLHLVLNRDGISNASINLAFLGACNFFGELPKEPKLSVYKKISDWNKRSI